jgi:hypothetical protein
MVRKRAKSSVRRSGGEAHLPFTRGLGPRGRNRGSKEDNAETQRSLSLCGEEGCIHQALQLRTSAENSALDEEL